MKIADTAKLNAERAAILTAFDDVWSVPRFQLTTRARRALRCAQRICNANTQYLIGSWGGHVITPDGRHAGRFIVR